MIRDGLRKRSLFREVNERIRDVGTSFGFEPSEYALLCECAAADCTERLPVPCSVYERVRLEEQRFLVASGHARPGEDVVWADSRWAVVALEAEQTAPARAGSDSLAPGLS